MAKNKKIVLILIGIAILGIVVRAYLSTLINKGDVLVQLEWAKVLYQEGLKDSYFYSKWTYSPPTQPPLMMLSFWLSRHIYENRYILAQMHNSIKIPPTFFILWFDKYGQFFLIRLWATIGDILAAFLIFYLVFKKSKNYRLSVISFSLIVFSPILLFETGIWGQNDLFSAIFIYFSFFFISSSHPLSFLISPSVFMLGILAKPVGLILLPFYMVYYIFRLIKVNAGFLFKISQVLISAFISLSLMYFLFLPFLKTNANSFSEIQNVFNRRIATSSKGVSKASISAFNFYSLFYHIDNTLGSQKILGLSLDNLGLIIFILITLISYCLLLHHWPQNFSRQIGLLSFLLFFISQGSYLFLTSMLDRYFLIGFIASNILLFFYFSKLGWHIVLQQFIWFINLIYAFYLRDLELIKIIFSNYNFLGIRIISFLSLINFFIIFLKFNKYFLKNK